MCGKPGSIILGCLALLVPVTWLAAQDPRSSQTQNPAAAQDAPMGKMDRAPGKPLQDELRAHLQAIFEVQLHALGSQKRQLSEEAESLVRQTKEQEAEALAQLKGEFERQAKQISRQANAQMEQIRTTVNKQATQLDLQAAMLKAELAFRMTVMSFQATVEEARLAGAHAGTPSPIDAKLNQLHDVLQRLETRLDALKKTTERSGRGR
jgi:hypothetical protein